MGIIARLEDGSMGKSIAVIEVVYTSNEYIGRSIDRSIVYISLYCQPGDVS